MQNLVFSFLIVSVGVNFSTGHETTRGCKWSECESDVMKRGTEICGKLNDGWFTGQIDKEGCPEDTSRSQCCGMSGLSAGVRRFSRSATRWTAKCYGIAHGPVWACNREFGSSSGWRPTGNKKSCTGVALTAYECSGLLGGTEVSFMR